MKGDFSRDTFDSKKHYARVLMQQGRVQLDADWNEQLDVTAHRIETETVDVIGECGTPLADPGFGIVVDPTTLAAPVQTRLTALKVLPLAAGDFLIAPGRYYVDGILCENEEYAAYSKQPDWFGTDPTKLPKQPDFEILPIQNDGWYLAYLDVWQRHLTALDDDAIREKALGGPDTATRAKTIWQVKVLSVPNNTKCSNVPNWDQTIAPSTGMMRARGEPEPPSANDCEVPPGAGYRRLENQLYRVEIHNGGTLATATFKWSRENGSIVRKWTAKNLDVLTISSAGRDENLGFAPGLWIELIDDTRELQGKPGTLVQLQNAQGTQLTILPATATGPVDLAAFPNNPKVRRWEGDGARKINVQDTPDNYIKLEDGVQIKFEAGTYRTGDYWLIPARTAIGDFMGGVEWEPDPLQPTKPSAQPPHGIQHHYCKLAIVSAVNKKITLEQDCRPKFPALDAMTFFFYVGGDGQEATPANLKLPQPLRVGVSNGNVPVSGAIVLFTKTIGNGALNTTGVTGLDGIASCEWTLENNPAVPSQQVEAQLLDDVGTPIHLPIFFNAKLEQPPATQGGSCCVCIGPDGDYKTLLEALIDLIDKRKLRDICICFMPGDHQVDWDDELSKQLADVNLKMTGCGDGTRLFLTQRLWFPKLNSVVLRDLDIDASKASNALLIEFTPHVHIENCFVRTGNADPSMIEIASAQLVEILNNRLFTRAGIALLLDDGNAETIVENNIIAGMMQLYQGTPILFEKMLPDLQPDLEKLRALILQGGFPLQGKVGTLHLKSNRMNRLTIAAELVKELAGGRKDAPLFVQSFYTNNRFHELGNFMLAEHAAFAENAFEPSEGLAALNIAFSAVYIGNRGGDPNFKSLFITDISFICDESANIMMRTPICAQKRFALTNDTFATDLSGAAKPKPARTRKSQRASRPPR